MGKLEKFIVIFTGLYIAVYTYFFFNIDIFENGFEKILPFHFFGMFLSLVFIVIVVRDIYKRSFENQNSKTTWTLLVILFWPSVFVYLPKYGFKPRGQVIESGNNKTTIFVISALIFVFFGFFGYSFYSNFAIPNDDIQSLAISGKTQKVQGLLSNHPEYAKLVRTKDNWSPLHGAAMNNHSDIVKILADYGADVNLKNCNGNTALHGASHCGYINVVKVLLASGADPKILNNKGRSALEIAEWHGHAEIANLLNKYN
ncbi:ankyrin repeat domain-containing protein [Desulfoluna spongiiphila]|uniref:ankyrin repeat domain-containing protein n=1 Tax=Desulfoluna spongiiphila TaxID=419481 RepID=UPI001257A7F1|nr:ankyrin repeat domain-containing protein [Desulfoluna spongiiphila]VVS91826.1 ankyrin repeats (many copies) [Desulfoluna spongiiphila]